MRIGLLLCDHVSEQFQHIITDYPEAFQALFAKQAPDMTLTVYDVCHGEMPQSPDACDGYLISGSKHSVYDDVEWIHRLSDFVREVHAHRRKLVGICFGHQMIAHALGGRVARSDRGWGIGIKSVQIHATKTWMQSEQGDYQLLLSHQDQVLDLPQGAEIIGGNAHCPVSMFAVGEYMLGIQAHPEFTPDYAIALMDSRLERIGAEAIDLAKATLASTTDEDRIARWIRAFFASA